MIIYIYACWRVAQLKQVSGCVCFIKKNAMFKCPGCLYCLYKLILLSVYQTCMQAVHFIFMNVEQYCIYMELTCQARPVLILYLHIASQKKKKIHASISIILVNLFNSFVVLIVWTTQWNLIYVHARICCLGVGPIQPNW